VKNVRLEQGTCGGKIKKTKRNPVMNKLLTIAISSMLLSGCGVMITKTNVAEYSTEDLCWITDSSFASDNNKSIALSELVKRGDDMRCSQLIAERSEAIASVLVGVLAVGAAAAGGYALANSSGGGSYYAPSSCRPGDVHVTGYYRADGTAVPSHCRTSPDDTKLNNYSCLRRGDCY
jgi:hypothetical protein